MLWIFLKIIFCGFYSLKTRYYEIIFIICNITIYCHSMKNICKTSNLSWPWIRRFVVIPQKNVRVQDLLKYFYYFLLKVQNRKAHAYITTCLLKNHKLGTNIGMPRDRNTAKAARTDAKNSNQWSLKWYEKITINKYTSNAAEICALWASVPLWHVALEYYINMCANLYIYLCLQGD